MTTTDHDYFMPDAAVEKSPLELAVDAVAEVLNKSTPIACVQETVTGSLVELALSLTMEDTDEDYVRLEVARALIRAGEEMLRDDAYQCGIEQGKHLASLKRVL